MTIFKAFYKFNHHFYTYGMLTVEHSKQRYSPVIHCVCGVSACGRA